MIQINNTLFIKNKEIITTALHIRTKKEMFFNFMTTIISGIFSYFNGILIENKYLFVAVTLVVLGDFIFGSIRAIKNNSWETNKALKIVYYFFTYYCIVFIVLSIKKAHPSAFWISDAIILPILLFQLGSMLKNMSLLGWIPQGLLLQLLNNIDKHKETTEQLNTTINEQDVIPKSDI